MNESEIESRHSIKCLEGMGSGSHDIEAELRMYAFTFDCNIFLDEESVAVVIPVTCVDVEVTGSIAVFALCY